MTLQTNEPSGHCNQVFRDYSPVVTIYADASCLRNGSPDSSAGCGAVIVDKHRKDLKLVAKYFGSGTNQQAEILACSAALAELRRPCVVEIVSDSRYVIDTMSGKNAMKSNRAFWSELVTKCYGHHVTWRCVRGHSGGFFQEAADRLSRAAATLQQDLSDEDLCELVTYLKAESSQLNIQGFERKLDTIVNRFNVSSIQEVAVNISDNFPSAFLA